MEDISLEELQEFEAAAAAAQRQSTAAHLTNRGMPSFSSQRPSMHSGPPPPDDFDPFEEDMEAMLAMEHEIENESRVMQGRAKRKLTFDSGGNRAKGGAASKAAAPASSSSQVAKTPRVQQLKAAAAAASASANKSGAADSSPLKPVRLSLEEDSPAAKRLLPPAKRPKNGSSGASAPYQRASASRTEKENQNPAAAATAAVPSNRSQASSKHSQQRKREFDDLWDDVDDAVNHERSQAGLLGASQGKEKRRRISHTPSKSSSDNMHELFGDDDPIHELKYDMDELNVDSPLTGGNYRARMTRAPPPPKVDYVFDKAPAAGEFYTMTSDNGDRVYLRGESEFSFDKKVADHRKGVVGKRASLLTTPVQRLLDQLDGEETERRLRERANQANNPDSSEMLLTLGADPTVSGNLLASGASELWVDKYAPRNFTELLSDEKTNREVLLWVKSWDKLVFGEERNAQRRIAMHRQQVLLAKQRRNALRYADEDASQSQSGNMPPPPRRQEPTRQTASIFNLGKKKNTQKTSFGPKAPLVDLRPEHKIILLAGPPGCGKTTLAHIIARHCGYNPLEINASDDRSAKVLTERLLAATEMNVILGKGNALRGEKKPNLVILDEIDGVDGSRGEGGGAIAELIKMVKAVDVRKTAAVDDEGAAGGDEKTKKRRKKVQKLLRRPIICICNDPYSRALRPLRDIAKVFKFEPPNTHALVARLEQICRKERVRAERDVLGQLTALTSNDVRSCLNTLQFVRTKHQRNTRLGNQFSSRLTATTLTSLSLGHKDMTRSLFEVLDAIFSKKKLLGTKKRRMRGRTHTLGSHALDVIRSHGNAMPQNQSIELPDSAESLSFKWQKLHNLITSQGDHRKILQMTHENFPSASFRDPTFAKSAEVADWIATSDVFSEFQQTNQAYDMARYVPYAAVVVHERCANDRGMRSRTTNRDWAMRETVRRHKAIVELFLGGSGIEKVMKSGDFGKSILPAPMKIGMRRFTTPYTAVLDTIPYLVQVVAPHIKPIPIHQMNAEQREVLKHLVFTMISCNLTYKESTSSYASLGFYSAEAPRLLEPPIDQLLNFQHESELGQKAAAPKKGSYMMSFQKKAKSDYNPHSAVNARITPMLKRIIAHEIELELMRRAEHDSPKEADVEEEAANAFSAQVDVESKEDGAVSKEADAAFPEPAAPAAGPRHPFFAKLRKPKAKSAAASSSSSSSSAGGSNPAVDHIRSALSKKGAGSALQKTTPKKAAPPAAAKAGLHSFFSPPATKSSSSSRRPKATQSPVAHTPTGEGKFGAKAAPSMLTQASKRAQKNFLKSMKPKAVKCVTYPIHFTFKEGHSQAVRRKVFVRDFVSKSA